MGYRSYGQLIFPTSQMDAYHRIADRHKDNSLDMWDEQITIDLKDTKQWQDSKYIRDNDSLTVLDFSGWKWYESYPSIRDIENFMDYLGEEQHTWLFWKKGEDLEDVEMREGAGYDSFHLSDGYSEALGIDSLHGYEEYSYNDSAYYYSLNIDDITKNTKKWNSDINKLKRFMEKELKLDLTDWDTGSKQVWKDGSYKPAQYLTVKIDQISFQVAPMAKLRKYLDAAEIGGSDEQWHLFLTKKEAGSGEMTVETIHGPHDPWDYELYPQMNVSWNWSPSKAEPPNCINYYSIAA